jgi:hypothetical protein
MLRSGSTDALDVIRPERRRLSDGQPSAAVRSRCLRYGGVGAVWAGSRAEPSRAEPRRNGLRATAWLVALLFKYIYQKRYLSTFIKNIF